jgi:hypothetical protein
MSKTGIIDRLEGELAVVECEDKMININLSKLPNGIKAGDVIEFQHDGTITLNKKETDQRKARIEKLMNELFEN